MPPPFYLCRSFPQPKHNPGLPPEAEAHWLVFSHADAGAGEVGESRSQEPGAHHCQREGRGCHRHPEDTVPTVQLLHGEPAATRAPSQGRVAVTRYSHFRALSFQICRAEDKFNSLVTFLRQHKHEKQLVFFRFLTKKHPFSAELLHPMFRLILYWNETEQQYYILNFRLKYCQ